MWITQTVLCLRKGIHLGLERYAEQEYFIIALSDMLKLVFQEMTSCEKQGDDNN
jgi:hypothetical protein